VVQKALKANRSPAMTGWEELIGTEGEVRVPLSPVGQVFVEGALWRARPADDGVTLDRGYRVRVESVDGLTLVVRPVGSKESKAAERAEEGVV
jgi:membrane-bound serine protease (ClpP class)